MIYYEHSNNTKTIGVKIRNYHYEIQESFNISIGSYSCNSTFAFVAQEEGYFDEEGLNVNLTQFSSASELVTGLESNILGVCVGRVY